MYAECDMEIEGTGSESNTGELLSASEEGKVGGIVGGIFACGSAVALAVGVAHYVDRKKNKERRGVVGEMSLLSPPGRQTSSSGGASVEPDV